MRYDPLKNLKLRCNLSCPPTCLPVRLPACLSACLPASLSACLSTYLPPCHCIRAPAVISGGAIATTAVSLTAINCSFTRNTAWRKAGGGALALSTTASTTSVQLCTTRFAANLAPQRPSAADVAGMTASGSLRTCGGSAFSGMKLQHAETLHASTSCT